MTVYFLRTTEEALLIRVGARSDIQAVPNRPQYDLSPLDFDLPLAMSETVMTKVRQAAEKAGVGLHPIRAVASRIYGRTESRQP